METEINDSGQCSLLICLLNPATHAPHFTADNFNSQITTSKAQLPTRVQDQTFLYIHVYAKGTQLGDNNEIQFGVWPNLRVHIFQAPSRKNPKHASKPVTTPQLKRRRSIWKAGAGGFHFGGNRKTAHD